MKKLLLPIFITLLALSCKNDDNSVATGSINISFDNRVSASTDLILGETTFITTNNETIKTSKLKYIISNISLTQDNGTVFTYPEEASYFVVNEGNTNSSQLNLTGIPAGNYTKLSFGLGVDQSKYPLNGMLDFIPTADEEGMLWNWAAGYKFIVFEGTYEPQGSLQEPFIIHVGSHGTTLDNYKVVTLPLTNAVSVSGSNTPTIQIQAMIPTILNGGTHQIKLADGSDIQINPEKSPKVAENAQSMFQVQ